MKKYSALSIVAPGGDHIRLGKKTLEIRKWKPDTIPLRNLLIVQNTNRLSRAEMAEDPNGKVVALVDIEAVAEWTEEDLEASCCSEWEMGWFAWKITNVRPVDYPIPVPAKLRIYDVDISISGEGREG